MQINLKTVQPTHFFKWPKITTRLTGDAKPKCWVVQVDPLIQLSVKIVNMVNDFLSKKKL